MSHRIRDFPRIRATPEGWTDIDGGTTFMKIAAGLLDAIAYVERSKMV